MVLHTDKKLPRATADSVAREANVSRVAVSRAFNPNASIKQDKRELILQVARELNYTPDMAARALVTKRSHLVAMIVPDVCSPWESQEIDALTTALQAEGFATLLFKAKSDFSIDPMLLTYMRGFNPDSVIAFTENIEPDVLTGFLDRAVPIYVIYDDAEPFAGMTTSSLFDRLFVQQQEGIEQAVALLKGYGVSQVAYLSGKQQSLANTERQRMITQVLAAHGLAAPVIVPGDFTYDTAYRATLDLFRVGNGADAVFASNDVGAFGVIDALRHDLQLSVPGDVKVIGFDDIPQSHWKSYNLTTVRIDLEDRVRALVRLILRRLKAPDSAPLVETLTTRLVVRGTVG